MNVAIKPLDWEINSRKRGRQSCKAQTPLGEFWATNIHGDYKVLRRHVWDNDAQDDILSSHASWAAAKKAAQAHYETLIKTTLV